MEQKYLLNYDNFVYLKVDECYNIKLLQMKAKFILKRKYAV